ncbi:MAG: hypothetical protein ACXAC0_07285 [Candidatus Thorarchaeota archaeon]|jgi:hypothetical protein
MNRSEFCLIACVLFLLSASNVAGLQTLPSISEPDDITYAEGETGNVIEWWVSYSTPLHYSIHRNNTVVRSENLGGTSGNITVSVDGLSMAVYFFVVIVDDFGNNVSTDLVIVTVLQEETTYPTGNEIDPLILVIGVSGAAIGGAIVILALLRQRR